MSLVYAEYRRGERAETCGTPALINRLVEYRISDGGRSGVMEGECADGRGNGVMEEECDDEGRSGPPELSLIEQNTTTKIVTQHLNHLEEEQNKMGNASAKAADVPIPGPLASPDAEKQKLKPCCACPETKRARDAWYGYSV
ncbi:hypothetical protein EVAR_89862_1 [Eumeta japonica]|uniref:Uncharacterized protein n=1 Tax=Eumeta variegata TaxID=151549 RepID=A0A4C1ZY00_EUMVA|nr:hypothetical protein EVAR_89862_1 [Eumeta japonica]